MSVADEPRCTIVIPAYNAPATIGAAIDSVLAQSVDDLELIVVDDGSVDETPELVERYCASDDRVRLIRQENAGTAAARNTGIAAARGEFVSLLDNDDLWMPNYLERMTLALERDPLAGFAYTDAWILDDESRQVFSRSALDKYPGPPAESSPDEFLSRLIEVNFVMSSATVRRSVIEKVGDFDASIKGVDDYELWLRIAAAGYRGVQAQGKLLIQRDRPDSQSKDELLMTRGLREVMRRVIEDHEVSEEIRDVARRRIEGLDQWERIVTGKDRFRAALLAIRLKVTGVVKRASPGHQLVPLPSEVSVAFPDLARRDA